MINEMRIAYLLPHLFLFGGIRRALELGSGLLKKGHKICFCTPTGETCRWFDSEVPVRKIEDACKDEFDVVIFSLESQHEEPKKFKTKAVVYYILHYGVKYKYPEICQKSYQQPYYQIANSSWTATKIQEETGRRPPVVYGGINTKMFHPVEADKKFDVLTYGDKTREWKGRKDVEKLETMKKEWKFGYMADINPPQDKIAETYNSAKVFFSASWFEGWNQMAIESMSCGVPLVITDDGGSSDYTIDGENCLIVPPKNPESAGVAIEKILGDMELRKKLIKGGLAMAKKFTWEISVLSLERHLSLSLLQLTR